MAEFTSLGKEELRALKESMQQQYDALKARNLKLDMSRGKPGADQLDFSMELLDNVGSKGNYKAEDGTDCRNYGVLDGLAEAKRIFAAYFETKPDEIIVAGNSSLNLMFDVISQGMTHGFGTEPWMKQESVKFICPVPGYDRHFGILEYFGIEMLNVDMLDDGPDMDALKELILDEAVKGMICVPKYSNPEGKTYSADVVRRLAAIRPAAKDFRIIWDNAYGVHDLGEESESLLNLLEECKKTGNEDIPLMFGSTSKITFPGAGVSALAASENNIKSIKKRLFYQTIGHDKLNQLRHARAFPTPDALKAHMKRHGEILAPKFDAVLSCLESELSGTGTACWVKPKGGYFISLNVTDGCAKRVVELCKQAGVVLTPAGATFPYGKDPRDRNIRIAPTFPPVSELLLAMELLCVCVKLAAIEKLENQG